MTKLIFTLHYSTAVQSLLLLKLFLYSFYQALYFGNIPVPVKHHMVTKKAESTFIHSFSLFKLAQVVLDMLCGWQGTGLHERTAELRDDSHLT